MIAYTMPSVRRWSTAVLWWCSSLVNVNHGRCVITMLMGVIWKIVRTICIEMLESLQQWKDLFGKFPKLFLKVSSCLGCQWRRSNPCMLIACHANAWMPVTCKICGSMHFCTFWWYLLSLIFNKTNLCINKKHKTLWLVLTPYMFHW